ncbi:MAG: PIN domain-containing protein [Bythopirellula sp.]|nr:PIN domain-containing protein [Bythopirellula sp.]
MSTPIELALLDTDILSELMKQQNPVVKQRAEDYFREQQQIAISAITCYQVLRWLREPPKAERLAQFQQILATQIILDVDLAILDKAANLWIEARASGRPREDVDLIIASTALIHDLTLVTANTKHFDWIGELKLDNWRET